MTTTHLYPLHGGPWDGAPLPFPPNRLPRVVYTTLTPEHPRRLWLGPPPAETVAVYEWRDGRLVFTRFCESGPADGDVGGGRRPSR
jgi:hypothetical protein